MYASDASNEKCRDLKLNEEASNALEAKSASSDSDSEGLSSIQGISLKHSQGQPRLFNFRISDTWKIDRPVKSEGSAPFKYNNRELFLPQYADGSFCGVRLLSAWSTSFKQAHGVKSPSASPIELYRTFIISSRHPTKYEIINKQEN